MTHFANPGLLWLSALLLPLIALYAYRALRGGAAIDISTAASFAGMRKGVRFYLRHVPFGLLTIATLLVIVALARPQSSESGSKRSTEGIDIVLALDISGSMMARDFQPDRMGAAKEVASKFVVDRPDDRIGLVVFAGESFTQSPLTTDKKTLLNLLSQVHIGMIEDGTAIGDGLATAVNRLKDSPAPSKVIILLTDGVNNRGRIAPLTAADIAAEYSIKVYTIGVGTVGVAPYPAMDIWGNLSFVPTRVEIDEAALRQISQMTGGEYFRATDNATLGEVYDRINSLEKNKVEVDDFTRYHELYAGYVLWALALLTVAALLQILVLRKIP